ncbi:MAG TPA: hypothetical protein VGD22_16750 [Sphingobacteriaceae bacterium]
MLIKLPAVIAIELVIILLSVLMAGDKTQIGEIASIYCFLTVVAALTYYIGIKF